MRTTTLAGRFFGIVVIFSMVTSAQRTAHAVRIPGLYNTGVDNAGAALPDNTDDPHYNIILGPAGSPVADETVAEDGFPIPPWLPNDAGSRWIGPAAPDGNVDPGTLLFETQFDMTGLDPNNAAIVGQWATDNSGEAILLNGVAVPAVPQSGFDAAGIRPFFMNSASAAEAGTGFVGGTNGLIFHVENAPPNVNPAGLRINNLYAEAAPLGSVALPGLYNTGVDDNGLPLADGTPDPHYTLVTSPAGTVDPATALAGPPSPPWVLNSASSRWIGPNNTVAGEGPPGDYQYEISFDLAGLVPDSAVISGLWSLDDDGNLNDPTGDILLNGQSIGAEQVGSFPQLTRFDISSGLGHVFNPGVNTLTFNVSNGGTADNPSGLRVEGLVAYANVIPEPSGVLLLILGIAGLLGARHGRTRAAREV